MVWRHVTDAQWDRIRPIYTPPRAARRAAGLPLTLGAASRAFSGPALRGANSRRGTAARARVGTAAAVDSTEVLLTLWWALLAQLNDAQKIRRNECFVDGSFAPAKKGAPKSDRPNVARGQSGWYWSMVRVLHWEHTRTRRPRWRSSSSKPRSG